MAVDPGENAVDIVAKSALAIATVAFPVLCAPPMGTGVIAVTKFIYSNQCNPLQMFNSATAWMEYGGELLDAASAADEMAASVSEDDWSGDDRDKFDEAIQGLSARLGVAAGYAYAIGTVLSIIALIMTIVLASMCVMAIVMATFAVQIGIAYASVLGAEAVPELSLACEEICASAVRVPEFNEELQVNIGSNGWLSNIKATAKIAAITASALIGVFTASSVIAIPLTGGGNPMDSLGHMLKDSWFDVAKGLAAWKANNLGEGLVGNAANPLLGALPSLGSVIPKYDDEGNFAGYSGGDVGAIDNLFQYTGIHDDDAYTAPEAPEGR